MNLVISPVQSPFPSNSHPACLRQSTGGFTLIELLVVISILSLLIAMLLPALGASRRAALNVKCLVQQRDIGLAINLYAHDYNDSLPGSPLNTDRWLHRLRPYHNRGTDSPWRFNHYRCPTQVQRYGNNTNAVATYGYNVFFSQNSATPEHCWRRMSDILEPSALPLVGDASGDGDGGLQMRYTGPHPNAVRYGWSGPTTVFGHAPNHDGNTNFLFADMRAASHNEVWPWSDLVGTDFHPRKNVAILP